MTPYFDNGDKEGAPEEFRMTRVASRMYPKLYKFL